MITTTKSAPGRILPGWLKSALLAMLVFGACWGIAIWFWGATDRSPTTADLVLYLGALPLALLMASGFARTRLAAPTMATPALAASVQPAQTHTGPPPLALLAAALRSPHGESAEELSAAIAKTKALADIDPELIDNDGFPVMTARISNATDEALQDEATDWWIANGTASPGLDEEQWRALTVATAVVGELASRATRDLIPPAGDPPMLHVHPILPPEWQTDQRRAAGVWLKHTVAQCGWPQACIALADDMRDITPTAIFDRMASEAAGGARVGIVAACASNISEDKVGKWAANGSLFTSSHPQGLVPGEGAAGVLVTDVLQARARGDGTFTLLDPLVEARSDSSFDDERRADSALLAELTERVLKRGAAELSDVAMIVADTGHRANRALELMGFASRATPQLDGEGDVLCVGAASGTCGAVPFMTALALAHHHVLGRNAPVLCISNEDPYIRCTALIRPADAGGKQGQASA